MADRSQGLVCLLFYSPNEAMHAWIWRHAWPFYFTFIVFTTCRMFLSADTTSTIILYVPALFGNRHVKGSVGVAIPSGWMVTPLETIGVFLTVVRIFMSKNP